MGNSQGKLHETTTEQKTPSHTPMELSPELEKKLRKITLDDPNMLCSYSGKKITKLCLNSKCKDSLRCSQLGCKNCGKQVHPLCSSVTIEQVTVMLNDRIQACKSFVSRVFEIEEGLIQKIRKSQKEIIQKLSSSVFEKTTQKAIKEIYQRKNLKAMSGSEALRVVDWLQHQVVSPCISIKGLIDRYSQKVDRTANQVSRLKESVIKQYLEERILPTTSSGFQNAKFDSKVMDFDSDQGKRQLSFLYKSFNQPVRFHLLYRASENKFSASAFHNNCDGIHDTLTIARTQFGKTIAGYTHYKWDQVSSGNFVHDIKRKSFILQLNLQQKMIPQRDNRLIACLPNSGPAFGWNDMTISDKCDVNKTSIGDFPCTYNREGNPYKPDSQESWTTFSGAQVGKTFKVLQYEVYHVQFY